MPYLSDHVAPEARINPARDGPLGTALQQALPLMGDQFSLTLRHGYYVTQHERSRAPAASATAAASRWIARQNSASPIPARASSPASRARLPGSMAEQRRRKQKLFGGLSITGSVSETPEGFSNKSLSAGFKKSW